MVDGSRDLLLERITASSGMAGSLKPIPWKPGTAPTPSQDFSPSKTAPFPKVDVLLWVYTVAEAEALADVFTPGIHHTAWAWYARDFASYENELTERSPAREEKRLAAYWLTEVDGKLVGVLQHALHVATDSTALPLRRFIGQLITEARPELVIDSGTSGGVGKSSKVGDVVVARNLRFDCQKEFRSESWARESFATTARVPTDWSEAERLIAPNWGLLAPQTTAPVTITEGDVLTTDFFAEDTANDKYGLRAYDPAARAVEMDASVLGLVAQDLGDKMPPYTSLRSVSDPQMPAGSSEEAASKIYLRYGYAAQVATSIACQQVILAADLERSARVAA